MEKTLAERDHQLEVMESEGLECFDMNKLLVDHFTVSINYAVCSLYACVV